MSDEQFNLIDDGWLMRERRFEFAKAALQGLLASNAVYGGRTNNYEALARDAWATADAMMKFLNEP